MADSEFVFKIPRGVDVVTEFPVRRPKAAAARQPSRSPLVSVLVAGCATSAALRRGVDAENRQDYDVAVAEYTQALRMDPDSMHAKNGLERSRLRASQDHFVKGRRLSALGVSTKRSSSTGWLPN